MFLSSAASAGAASEGPPRLGDSGAAVVALQEQLNRLGYRGEDGNALEVRSGVFGAHTDHALRAFQADRDLEVDGIFGRESQKAIGGALREHGGNGDLIRQGDKGNSVSELQDRLNALGATDASRRCLAVDGNFGDSTREAVLNLQRAQGLKVDGIAGPETLGKMSELTRGQSSAQEQRSLSDTSPGSQASFVERMLSAAKDSKPLEIRGIVEGFASSDQCQQWQKQVAEQNQADPAKSNPDLAR